MKKLSQLPMNAMICANDIESLMTKKEYLGGGYTGTLYETGLEYVKFNLQDSIESQLEDYHEDWDDIYDDILENRTVKEAIKIINEILESRPIYYPGAKIIDDMTE